MVGTRDVLIEYLGIMVKLITEAELKVKQGDASYNLGHFEMLISNYVAYRYFSNRLIHGREVSTILTGSKNVVAPGLNINKRVKGSKLSSG